MLEVVDLNSRIKYMLLLFSFSFLLIVVSPDKAFASSNPLELQIIYTDYNGASQTVTQTFSSPDRSTPFYVILRKHSDGLSYKDDILVYSKNPTSSGAYYEGAVDGYRHLSVTTFGEFSINTNYYVCDSLDSDWQKKVKNLLNGDDSGLELVKYKGSIDFPTESDDIGTLILDKTKMYEESDGENVNDLYNLWSWKDKTSSGFSLSKNKYKDTCIQVRVESKCVVYSDFRHKKVKSHFDNYGEKAMLFDSLSPDSKPLKVSYLTDVPKVLPLTHAETHNPLFVGYDYTLYFRVVCQSDKGKWYSGGWRACDCNADILNGQTDTSENGHFDDDDNWVPDSDDGHNKIDSGSESVHDSGDAKDDFNNTSNKSDLSVDNAKNTIKDMLEMVGFIPTMIGTLFSFLPSWCLNMLAVFFVSLCVLIVYKLIRG